MKSSIILEEIFGSIHLRLRARGHSSHLLGIHARPKNTVASFNGCFFSVGIRDKEKIHMLSDSV